MNTTKHNAFVLDSVFQLEAAVERLIGLGCQIINCTVGDGRPVITIERPHKPERFGPGVMRHGHDERGKYTKWRAHFERCEVSWEDRS